IFTFFQKKNNFPIWKWKIYPKHAEQKSYFSNNMGSNFFFDVLGASHQGVEESSFLIPRKSFFENSETLTLEQLKDIFFYGFPVKKFKWDPSSTTLIAVAAKDLFQEVEYLKNWMLSKKKESQDLLWNHFLI